MLSCGSSALIGDSQRGSDPQSRIAHLREPRRHFTDVRYLAARSFETAAAERSATFTAAQGMWAQGAWSMQLIDGRPVYSATDLVGFLECRHLANLERAAVSSPSSRFILGRAVLGTRLVDW